MDKLISFIKDHKIHLIIVLAIIIIVLVIVTIRIIKEKEYQEDIQEAESILQEYDWDETSSEEELDETQTTIYDDLNYGVE